MDTPQMPRSPKQVPIWTNPNPSLPWSKAMGSRVARVHNVSAGLFFACLLSGLALDFSVFQGWIGHREFVREFHVITGILAVLVGMVAFSPLKGFRILGMWRMFMGWTHVDSEWLGAWISTFQRPAYGRDRPNPGQKLGASAIFASMVVLAATGLILRFFAYFPLWMRSGSTLAHNLFFYLVSALVIGHIVFVVASRDKAIPVLSQDQNVSDSPKSE